jgi:hypothetical protein
MKKKWFILLILLLLLCVGVFVVIINTNKPKVLIDTETTIQQAISKKETEKVSCSSTVPTHCYLYKCNSGYIYSDPISAPGNNPLRCTDGSEIEQIRKVIRKD